MVIEMAVDKLVEGKVWKEGNVEKVAGDKGAESESLWMLLATISLLVRKYYALTQTPKDDRGGGGDF